jgi:hypothetical protein
MRKRSRISTMYHNDARGVGESYTKDPGICGGYHSGDPAKPQLALNVTSENYFLVSVT